VTIRHALAFSFLHVGDALLEPEAVASLLLGVFATGRAPIGDSPEVGAYTRLLLSST
jgi:hypothetical protein